MTSDLCTHCNRPRPKYTRWFWVDSSATPPLMFHPHCARKIFTEMRHVLGVFHLVLGVAKQDDIVKAALEVKAAADQARIDGSHKQPDPTANTSQPIVELVINDMRERALIGEAKYGRTLQAHNGARALLDAYEKVLDLAQYLKQEILESAGSEADLTKATKQPPSQLGTSTKAFGKTIRSTRPEISLLEEE